MAHWKKSFNPDYLGAYSIEDGRDIIGTIKSVKVEQVTGTGGKKEECLVCRFVENIKPMILNKTNCKTISKIYKTPDTDNWVGKRIQIFATTTKLAGEVVECLRIRDIAPETVKEEKIPCEECGSLLAASHGMTVEQFANYSRANTGRVLCLACMRKMKEQKNAEANE